MKKVSIFLIIALASSFLFGQDSDFELDNRIEIKTYYDSNILNLSSKDIDEFLTGQQPEKYKLKSVNDYVTGFDIELAFKHRLLYDHTQISKFIFSYDKYWKNGFKDFKFLSFELIQYLSRYIDIRAKYTYYPYIFINRYGSNVYPYYYDYYDFSYAKNLYSSGFNIRFLDYTEIGYNFEYTTQNYNKYFPEYDAYNFVNEGWIAFRPLDNSKFKFRYTYVTSIAKAEKVYESRSIEIRDPSYDSNIFYISLSMPLLPSRWNKSIKLFTSFKWENKYFQSPFSPIVDPFHSGRKDTIFHFEGWLIYPLWHVLDFRTFFTYESRNAHSPKGSLVSNEKNYITRTWGVSLQAKF
ncbi:MAG TPA: hypothetical protein ENG70_04405 [Candidatus Cloacimonetes bacterium]|nr:hypothetical protein [Candidatus Cloacimonadota bacterium]HEX38085.1 hypothetical protein [Candidatus Cloacimonadota bacterium]